MLGRSIQWFRQDQVRSGPGPGPGAGARTGRERTATVRRDVAELERVRAAVARRLRGFGNLPSYAKPPAFKAPTLEEAMATPGYQFRPAAGPSVRWSNPLPRAACSRAAR